jgi:hypothetical protein
VGQCDQNRSPAKSNPATNGIADYNSNLQPTAPANGNSRSTRRPFRSIAPFSPSAGYFRSAPNNGHHQAGPVVPVGARCRLMRRSKREAISSPRRRGRTRVHSGNPAFRRPSISSFEFDCPPRAIHPDIVKAQSSSSTRAAASRASASRPRCAKAAARQR